MSIRSKMLRAQQAAARRRATKIERVKARAKPRPLRKVSKFEYIGACRYTGYIPKSVKLHLECGHEITRKASTGTPVRARCLVCHNIALSAMIKNPDHFERMMNAEYRGNQYLADANEASERGDKMKADKFYEKGQFWLDRYNKLAGNS